jgi:hypothetical protein
MYRGRVQRDSEVGSMEGMQRMGSTCTRRTHIAFFFSYFLYQEVQLCNPQRRLFQSLIF